MLGRASVRMGMAMVFVAGVMLMLMVIPALRRYRSMQCHEQLVLGVGQRLQDERRRRQQQAVEGETVRSAA